MYGEAGGIIKRRFASLGVCLAGFGKGLVLILPLSEVISKCPGVLGKRSRRLTFVTVSRPSVPSCQAISGKGGTPLRAKVPSAKCCKFHLPEASFEGRVPSSEPILEN